MEGDEFDGKDDLGKKKIKKKKSKPPSNLMNFLAVRKGDKRYEASKNDESISKVEMFQERIDVRSTI